MRPCIRYSVCVGHVKTPDYLTILTGGGGGGGGGWWRWGGGGGGLEAGYTIRDNLQHLVLSGVASLSSTQATHSLAAEVVLTLLPSHWSQLVISESL